MLVYVLQVIQQLYCCFRADSTVQSSKDTTSVLMQPARRALLTAVVVVTLTCASGSQCVAAGPRNHLVLLAAAGRKLAPCSPRRQAAPNDSR